LFYSEWIWKYNTESVCVSMLFELLWSRPALYLYFNKPNLLFPCLCEAGQPRRVLTKWLQIFYLTINLMGLCRLLDGFAYTKYKLLCFLRAKFFWKEKKALAFNRDRCCNLALCLQLIIFHCRSTPQLLPHKRTKRGKESLYYFLGMFCGLTQTFSLCILPLSKRIMTGWNIYKMVT